MIRFLTATRELELANARIEELKQEVASVRAQLLSEIDSNRTREDALVNQLAPKAPLPRRELLAARRQVDEDVDRRTLINLDDADVDEADERLLLERCKEFYAQAREAGATYPFQVLLAAAKEDPSFLDN